MTFEEFWQIYPRRESKKTARKAWDKLKITDAIAWDIRENIQARIDSGQWDLTDKQYILHPATYLNGERWEDEVIQRKQRPTLYENLTDRSWAEIKPH